MLMCPHHLHYFFIFCAFLFVVYLKKPQIVKNGELIPNFGKYRVNIILDDKTLQYFHVPIAYQIQQIIYKTMGLSIFKAQQGSLSSI